MKNLQQITLSSRRNGDSVRYFLIDQQAFSNKATERQTKPILVEQVQL